MAKLPGLQQVADNRWKSRCPAHEDQDPSLSVRQDEDGTVLVKCYAGCSTQEVLAACGIEYRRLMETGRGSMSRPTNRGPSEYDRHQWAKVYAYMMAELDGPIDEDQLDDLKKRGMDPQAARAYRSLGPEKNAKAASALFSTFRGRIWDVPGIVRRPDGKPDLAISKGLLVPMRDHEGWVRACQVRTGLAGSKYVWFTQGGKSTAGAIHFTRRPKVKDLWVVTEGPLKADVAQCLHEGKSEVEFGNHPVFVAPGGVGAWQSVANYLDKNDVPRPEGIVLAFDMEDKPGVKAAKEALIAHAKKRKVDTFEATWSGAKGVDDALLAGVPIDVKAV